MNLSVTTENDPDTTEKPDPAEKSDSTANESVEAGDRGCCGLGR